MRKYIIYFALTILSFLMGDSPIRVFNRSTGINSELKTFSKSKEVMVSAKEFAHALSLKVYENIDRKKIVLYIAGRRVKISGNSSFILVDEQIFQMQTYVKYADNELFIPVEAFIKIMRSSALPGISYDARRGLLDVDVVGHNITGMLIEEKSNGTIIRIQTKKLFSERNISSFMNKNGWYYLTISGGSIDTFNVNITPTRGVVRKIEADQLGQSAQVAFKLGGKIISHEWVQSRDPDEIILTLRTPLGKGSARIKTAKERWHLNTIVLDAGHGGKDAGTTGKRGTKEKDITLDIVKRLGKIIEKKLRTRVVYTREEDVFVPLWKRTKIANESNGKLFVSIHANANPNRTIKGFETYLLSPGKNKDAVEVASRENSAIKLEEINGKYQRLTGENLIMATMAQSMFLKESEDLASIIQMELDKKLDSSPNRGIKQAGFYVLIGASMPNVLVEVGFVSNPQEEIKLTKASYRQKIAESIYNSIRIFKTSREKVLANE
ncbi:MAG: N-acetylmuramoyl-L-alanine amidase [Candidatus Marinimicrobia bacterium]|nr:N-acetylmuramoyl-L-alanine amidase [Candidatus Neomarinimicrobiota bacterium]MBT3497104.1 N-acetylmuramoyl-L-alanine amidase [Candidatus Neomarinimicrobiota bacterium]MBT3691939.1 N-acetylmuramoyl-L-alanine amidase [Candidatus Neomarinimicrobiota bacterium]MBT3732030.1 N-acetylmuramoyl-L-alanine amidase [Candidatus Neomarinimicrobiota bacterium]MBT4144202.1 N-acetylmuramoyl-L-alanine amidase [Candidatus Neomarinimicrobiota bacterium]